MGTCKVCGDEKGKDKYYCDQCLKTFKQMHEAHNNKPTYVPHQYRVSK